MSCQKKIVILEMYLFYSYIRFHSPYFDIKK